MGNTGLWLTGANGQLTNLSNPSQIGFSGAMSVASQATISVPIAGVTTPEPVLTASSTSLVITAQSFQLTGTVSIVDSFLGQGTDTVSVDWTTGLVGVQGTLSIGGGLFTTTTPLLLDGQGNIWALGAGTTDVTVPKDFSTANQQLLGAQAGATLHGWNFYLQVQPGQPIGQSFAAAWTTTAGGTDMAFTYPLTSTVQDPTFSASAASQVSTWQQSYHQAVAAEIEAYTAPGGSLDTIAGALVNELNLGAVELAADLAAANESAVATAQTLIDVLNANDTQIAQAEIDAGFAPLDVAQALLTVHGLSEAQGFQALFAADVSLDVLLQIGPQVWDTTATPLLADIGTATGAPSATILREMHAQNFDVVDVGAALKPRDTIAQAYADLRAAGYNPHEAARSIHINYQASAQATADAMVADQASADDLADALKNGLMIPARQFTVIAHLEHLLPADVANALLKQYKESYQNIAIDFYRSQSSADDVWTGLSVADRIPTDSNKWIQWMYAAGYGAGDIGKAAGDHGDTPQDLVLGLHKAGAHPHRIAAGLKGMQVPAVQAYTQLESIDSSSSDRINVVVDIYQSSAGDLAKGFHDGGDSLSTAIGKLFPRFNLPDFTPEVANVYSSPVGNMAKALLIYKKNLKPAKVEDALADAYNLSNKVVADVMYVAGYLKSDLPDLGLNIVKDMAVGKENYNDTIN
jgi:hypothetical protein